MGNIFDKSFKIGKFTISSSSKAFIIAEIGSNHDQSLSTAKKYVDVAKKAGADAVKFQSLRFSEQYLETATPKAVKTLHKQIDFSDDNMRQVALYAQKKGIMFMSSATYPDAVDFLEKLNVPAHKIASPITVGFTSLILKLALTHKPLILSTGYCTKNEIDRAMDVVQKTGNKKLVMLYCTSSYPTDAEDIDFGLMQKLGKTYSCLMGFSDHTMSTVLPAIAVAKGARVIEKHLTLSRKLKGPDHPFAIEPEEFKQMVENIRDTELTLRPRKTEWRELLPFEKMFKKKVLMKLVTACDLAKGTKIIEDNILFRRAAGGIPEYELQTLVGKTLTRSLRKLTLLKPGDFKK